MPAKRARLLFSRLGIGSAGRAAVFRLDADGHFAERINPFRDCFHHKFGENIWFANDAVDGFVHRVHGSRADGGIFQFRAVGVNQTDGGGGAGVVAAGNVHILQFPKFGRLVNFIGDDGFQIGIGDNLLFVRNPFEPLECLIQFLFGQIAVSQFFQPNFKSVSPRMFAQHQRTRRQPDRFRAHNFISGVVFQHPILMNARFVRKRIRADNGFIRLDGNAGICADHTAGAGDLGGVNVGGNGELLRAGGNCHHHFFQTGIARALADAVDGHFHLPCAVCHARQRVRCRQPQIVVAVG